jgi:cyanophycinase
MAPKGTLVIIGGAEDKGDENRERLTNTEYKQFEILRELVPPRRKGSIEIITTASGVPNKVADTYRAAFKKIGFSGVGFMDIRERNSARAIDFASRLEKADTVFFSGGDQFKLSTILGGTDLVAAIREKFIRDKNFVVAGTSAGAMALPRVMIYEGGVHEALLKDDLKMASGLGIYDSCIVDTHFIKRGRFGRLAHAVAMNPAELGIGLGEDTALIIRGDHAECRGSGMVVIVDGSCIEQTNIMCIDNGAPIFVDNLRVHILAKGSSFSLKERKVRPVSLPAK